MTASRLKWHGSEEGESMDDLTGGLANHVARAESPRINNEKFSLQKSLSIRLSLPRRIFRKLVHFLSYKFILELPRTTVTRVAGLELTIRPTVFHPRIFLTSKFFANFIQGLDLSGKRVADVGTGSGILALSAAKAGALSVLALDINPAAAETAAFNAAQNGLSDRVMALQSDLFSAVMPGQTFDVVMSSPPSFSGEPRSVADRAWHAGLDYRDIATLFEEARIRMAPGGVMYLLLSSDSNLGLLGKLIDDAGFSATFLAAKSILVESFILYELRQR